MSGIDIITLPLALIIALLFIPGLIKGVFVVLSGRCVKCDVKPGQRHEYDCPLYYARWS